jgi:hypothetical protein
MPRVAFSDLLSVQQHTSALSSRKRLIGVDRRPPLHVFGFHGFGFAQIDAYLAAPLAELVDAPDSKSGSERSAGSIPAGGTKRRFHEPSLTPRKRKKAQKMGLSTVHRASVGIKTSPNFVGIYVGIKPSTHHRPRGRYQQMPLTDTQIKNIKKQATAKKYSDGGGLHLFVTTSGSKLWRMSYRFEGSQKTLSFGAYPAVPLSQPGKCEYVANAKQAREGYVNICHI